MTRQAKASSAGSISARGTGFLAVLCLLVALLLAPASALALESHPHQGTIDPSATPNGSFGPLGGLAVGSGGALYAIDTSGAHEPAVGGAVDHFDATGNYLSPQIEGSPTTPTALSLYEGSDVAVGPTGTVYVTDTFNNQIDAFDPTDASLETSFDGDGELTGAAIPLEQNPEATFAYPCGLAVDQTSGDLYVADPGHNRIWIFSPSGAYLAKIADGALSGPCGLAFDSTGSLYVRNSGDGRVLKFDPSHSFQSVLYAPSANDPENPNDDSPPATDVAVDTTTNNVYVDTGDRILEFEASGALLRSFGQGDLSGSTAIAVDPESGKVYAAAGQSLHVFGALTTLPDSTTGEAGAIVDTAATLNGSVDSAGGPEAECHFEYGTDTSYGQSAPCAPAGPYAGFQEVSASLSALSPITTYHYRLIGSNANGESKGEDKTFTTVGLPAIDKTFASGVTSTSATLNARIDPNGSETSYQFEYVTEAQFQANGFAGATKAPVPPKSIGSVDVPEPSGSEEKPDPLASQSLIGLSPGTAYRYRVIVSNGIGPITSEPQSFHTFALPTEPTDTCPNAAIRAAQGAQDVGDCRAFEMVSPVDKNGGDVMGDPEKTRAAADGGAVTFASLAGFAGTGGSGLQVEYMGVRGPDGWSTHPLMPVQEPGDVNVGNPQPPAYLGEFSEDLSTAVFRSLSPLTDAPKVAGTHNLYVRNDLRAPGPGSYQLLTDSQSSVPLPPYGGLTPPNSGGYAPAFAGASSDFHHVVFQSELNLSPDASGQETKLYESVDGVVRLAGVLPNGQPATCPSGEVCSISGRGASGAIPSYTATSVSREGSRIIFTSPDNGQTPTPESQLYQRIDGTHTIKLSESELSRPPTIGDLEPEARFQFASADGTKVFFISTAQLTNDDENSGRDLYEYDASKPDHHHLTRIATIGDGTGAIAASANGDIVYFIAGRQLTAEGQVDAGASNFGGGGIFVYRAGAIHFIGRVPLRDVNGLISQAGYTQEPLLARITPDGTHLVFMATNGTGLTGYDHGLCRIVDETGNVQVKACPEVYVYDATANGGAGKLSCASCNPSGAAATEEASFFQRFGFGNAATTSHLNRAVSADGKRVFFSTRERLLSADRNGNVRDVYEYDTETGKLHLITTGTGSQDAYFLEASASGDDVFFITRDQLVGADIDNGYDLYDARVEGGFPEPAHPAVCEGDACVVPPAAPNDPTPASSSYQGAGNAKAPVKARCRKASKKAKGKAKSSKARCTKAKKQHHQRANTNRRAGR